jgi:Tfp pilus assembly PilM family ATPase
MTRRPCTFRKADVTRAAKAVQAAGLEVGFVEVSREGLIRVIPRNPVQQSNPQDQHHNKPWTGSVVEAGDLDHELAEFKTRHGQN